MKNAPDVVKEFHDRHPEAPRKISAATFNAIRWKPLENLTVPDKGDRVRRILRSRDLAP